MSEESNKALSQTADKDAKVKAPEKAPGSKKQGNPKQGSYVGRGFMFLRTVFSLLLLGGLAYLGFVFIEQDKAIEVLSAQQSQFSQADANNSAELASQQTSLQALTQANAGLLAQLAEQNLELERLNRDLISTRLRINDSGTAINQVWTLTEAESLLRLAQQRLIISRDVRSALALYVASDDILKQINDPAIFTIRNILAADMAALRAVTEIDVQGMYLQLGALAQSIDSLQVISGVERMLPDTTGRASEENTNDEEAGFFDSLGKTLSSYIVVRRRDEPIQPLLTPEQELYLKQNIKLQLEQARLSLLQGREEIYRNSIETALSNIEQHLQSTGAQKQSIIQALEGLKQAPIVEQVPVVSNSLTALQQILPLSEIQSNEGGEQ